MTYAKCFNNWLKEAGRGHLCALLSWGLLLVYGITMLTRLSFDTEVTYFGTGSVELVWICAGLGILLSFFEFFYLLQPRKQDLYYSLPVTRGVIFWSRYIHGLGHFLIPLVLVMAVCGAYEGTVDGQFLAVSVSYTGKSILEAAAVFLIFYHIGTACMAVCGNVVSSIFTCGAFLLFGNIFMRQVLDELAQICFQTYYRLPLVEKLTEMVTPLSLAGRLSGLQLFEKKDVLSYTPEAGYIWAAVLWIGAGFLIFSLAVRKRKTERTGRDYVSVKAERTAEILLSILAGSWAGTFVLDITGLADQSSLAAAGAGAAVCGVSVLAVHSAMEWRMEWGKGKAIRRKVQLAAEGVAGICIFAAFFIGAGAFDNYFPKAGETVSIGVSIDGLGMDDSSYQQKQKGDVYQTDFQLAQYTLDGEGRLAALTWLDSLAEAGRVDADNAYTSVTVCYTVEGGGEHYRTYPLTRADFEAFASVYETEEYKEIAYPAPEPERTEESRFSWNDGVKQRDMKIAADEKEALAKAWISDRTSMKMSDLSEMLPVGFLKITSGEQNFEWEMPVYPSFAQTRSLLEKYGVDTEKGLEDYPVIAVEVQQITPVPAGVSGGAVWNYYDDPEDIAGWKPRLVPKQFDLQPLLCPLDYRSVTAAVEDEETNSTVEVDCFLLENPGEK